MTQYGVKRSNIAPDMMLGEMFHGLTGALSRYSTRQNCWRDAKRLSSPQKVDFDRTAKPAAEASREQFRLVETGFNALFCQLNLLSFHPYFLLRRNLIVRLPETAACLQMALDPWTIALLKVATLLNLT